jgi:hypothetical protein
MARILGILATLAFVLSPALALGGFGRAAQAQSAPPHHFVIAAIGDSAASGEGNPEVPVLYGPNLTPLTPAIWADGTGPLGKAPGTSKCHRSHYAPGAQAAQRIGEENPGTTVTLYLKACTGATIGLPLAQEIALGHDISTDDTAIKQLSHLPPGHIDALFVMVGANDIGGGYKALFIDCLQDNILHGLNGTYPSCSHDAARTAQITADIRALPAKYADLAAAIRARGDIGKVYITEYFDPTHHADGTYGTVASNYACSYGLLPADSWQWGHDVVFIPLNAAVAAAAQANGWTFVGGIAAQFLHHGYCAWTQGQNWVVASQGYPLVLQSQIIQGDINGTAHANHAGQLVYRGAIPDAVYRGTTPTTTANVGGDGDGPASVTLAADTPLQRAGIGATYYAIDNPACAPTNRAACSVYSGPFAVRGEGRHTVSFFSVNAFGTAEALRSLSVDVED